MKRSEIDVLGTLYAMGNRHRPLECVPVVVLSNVGDWSSAQNGRPLQLDNPRNHQVRALPIVVARRPFTAEKLDRLVSVATRLWGELQESKTLEVPEGYGIGVSAVYRIVCPWDEVAPKIAEHNLAVEEHQSRREERGRLSREAGLRLQKIFEGHTPREQFYAGSHGIGRLSWTELEQLCLRYATTRLVREMATSDAGAIAERWDRELGG